MRIPSLYQFFRRQLQQGFASSGIDDLPALDYVSDMLTRFSRTQQLYPITSSNGETLEHIVDFTIEARRAQGWDGHRPDRARELMVTRHIGEYTLFMSGLFRERLQARRELDYYYSHGRSAYLQCADFTHNPNSSQLFRNLATNFPTVANILASLRQQLPTTLSQTATLSPLAAMWHK